MANKPSIRQLQEELFLVKEKCQDIGIQLDLDDSSLDKIERTHSTDHSTQLRQILRLWLEREDACWENLIKVLRVPIINEEALAIKLEAKYCTIRLAPMASTSQTSVVTASTSQTSVVTASTSQTPTLSLALEDLKSFYPDSPQPTTVAMDYAFGDPSSFGVDEFVRTPPADRLCTQCNRVPRKPRHLECCNRLYCLPCAESLSSRMQVCSKHHTRLAFKTPANMARVISDTTVRCVKCKRWKGLARHLGIHRRTCPENTGAQVHSSSTEHPAAAATSLVGVPLTTLSPIPPIEIISPPSGINGGSTADSHLKGTPSFSDAHNPAKRPAPGGTDDTPDSLNYIPSKVPRITESTTYRPNEPIVDVCNSSEFEMLTSFSNDDCIETQKSDQKCTVCHRVPRKAKKSKCCETVYCEPCASKAKPCLIHQQKHIFGTHPELNVELSKLMVRCKNHTKGCVWKKPSNQLKDHLLSSCEIPCPYSSLGCKATVTNRSISGHMEAYAIDHLDSLRKNAESLMELNSQLKNDVSAQYIPQRLFMIFPVSEHKSTESGWVSPSFYIRQLGCKVHLVMWFSGSQTVMNTNVVHDEGVNDDALEWPCRGTMVIEIVNQAKDEKHSQHTMNFILNKEAGSFSSHCQLVPVRKSLYIVKDKAYVRVVRVSIDSQIPWL